MQREKELTAPECLTVQFNLVLALNQPVLLRTGFECRREVLSNNQENYLSNRKESLNASTLLTKPPNRCSQSSNRRRKFLQTVLGSFSQLSVSNSFDVDDLQH